MQHWVSKTVKDSNIPAEVVTDGSKALLNAVSLSCNGVSYKEYLIRCYNFLTKKTQNITLYNTYIRLDSAHLIKVATRWKCFVKIEENLRFLCPLHWIFNNIVKHRSYKKSNLGYFRCVSKSIY